MHGSKEENRSQILIISPEPWNGHFVSKHHYAETLAMRGQRVYFLNPPDNTLGQIEVNETKQQNLWEVSAPQVAKGLRFYPQKLRNLLERRWLEKLEAIIGQKFTTVWLFENSRFYDMGFAGSRTKIYHQVDLNQNFHVKEAASSANICFCTTDIIKKKLYFSKVRVYKIHHAVAEYSNTKMLLSIENIKKLQEHKINVMYVGNLNMAYLDVKLLSNTIEKFPYVIFHFIGACKRNEPLYESCKGYKNINWWGRVDSQMILNILSKSDVLLLAYKMEFHRDQASPHKVMEYLGSGKVTVATYTDEYKDKRHLLEMVDDSKDYLETFERVISDLSFYNSAEKQKERVTFAENNTYSKQLDTIISYLDQHNLHL